MRRALQLATVAAGVALAASAMSAGCSSTLDAADPADANADANANANANDGGDFGAPSTTYPAYVPASVPQVVNPWSGPTLKSFTVVPVVFAGDSAATSISDFMKKYAASPEWTAAVKEYGVGTFEVAPAIVLTEKAPSAITDDEIRQFLAVRLDGTHPEWGATDAATLAKTVYAIAYPDTTQVSAKGASCDAFLGYHDVARPFGLDGGVDAGAGDPSKALLYIVTARCRQPGFDSADTLTALLAHELVETATDPYVSDQLEGGAAYRYLDEEHTLWGTSLGSTNEIADLCNLGGTFWAPPSVGYTISRSWSNAAANQHHNPCVPTPPGEPYFNSFPQTPDSFNLYATPSGLASRGVSLPIGTSKTVDVMLFSDAPTDGPWVVSASESPALPGRSNVLSLSLDRTSGVNGEKLHLTIVANATPELSTTSVVLISALGPRVAFWSMPVLITP
jgi:hypothetical protein